MAIDRRNELAENLRRIKAQIPREVHLIVVTKTFPLSDVQILHDLGVFEFGENRDQEGKLKAPNVPGKWHFQGQLQSNKLRSISTWADVIQTVDSVRYVELLSKATTKELEVFIQVSLDPVEARDNRAGADVSQINQIADAVLATEKLKLQGLMAVAPIQEAPDLAFERLAKIHQDFKAKYPNSPYLSAGMSGDFQSAIAHGATHIRIGSQILGTRSANL